MRPKSSTLFHFTKNADFLRGILLNGLQPRLCLEDTRWLKVPDHDYVAYPMVCFCDIPLSRLSEHTTFYGSYGIGLTREWGHRNKLCPVIYSPVDSSITKITDFLFDLTYEHLSDKAKQEKAAHSTIYRAISLIKPLQGNMLTSHGLIEKDFYQENEWRYVPEEEALLFKSEFDSEREAENKKMEKHALKFNPYDIKYLFVQNDNEIPELVDFINTKLGHFPHNALKILSTRIVSLESIALDL